MQSHRTVLCPQRCVSSGAVSVPVRRTDISTHAAQVSRGQQSLCVAQAPQASQALQAPQSPQAPRPCPDPSLHVRSAAGGRVRPARPSRSSSSPCVNEVHDRDTAVRCCDLEDGHGVPATASEHSEDIGLREVAESDFPSLSNLVNSCLGLSTSACARASRVARAVAPAGVCLGSSSSAESAAVVHAHASTLHGARNSGGTGGLLLVQRSTSHCLDFCSQGPTRRKGTKGVEAGVNFGPAGSVRGQVAGH